MKLYVFAKRAVVLWILILAVFYSGCDKCQFSGKKTKKQVKHTAIDYFDVNNLQTVRLNDVEYTIIDNERIEWARKLFLEKDFPAVQAHILELLNNDTEDGSVKLTALYNTLARITDNKHIEHMLTVLDEWCAKAPENHMPWLARGHFYISWAWSIRGGSWAKDVPKEAWSGFNEKLALAQKDLERSYTINPMDPNSSCYLVTVAKGLGYPKETMEQYYQNGVRACSWHIGLHGGKLDYLSPRWFGSADEMLAFAKESFEKADQYPRLGLMLVRAYADIHKQSKEENILGREDVWKMVKGTHERLFNLDPDELRFHFSYAYYAFLAKQYEEALKQFEVIGDRWSEETVWSSLDYYNHSRGLTNHMIGYNLLYKKHLYPVSIGYLQSAVRYSPTAGAYYDLGIAYWYTGNSQQDVSLLLKAEDALKKALAIKPDHEEAKKQLQHLQTILKKN